MLTSRGFLYEASALSRTLIEIVINGAYLMVTGEVEFNAYVAHPVVLLGKHHKAYLNYQEGEASFTGEFNEMVATSAAQAALISGRTSKDSSWTSESVTLRADRADSVFKHGLFCDLARTVYVDGHDFIHGNFPAILDCVNEFQGDLLPRSELMDRYNSIHRGATSALLGYALSLNHYFASVFQSEFHLELLNIIKDFANDGPEGKP